MVFEGYKEIQQKLRRSQKFRIHSYTVATILTIGVFAYGLRKIALALKSQHGKRVNRYHEEVEDFIYNKELAEKRQQQIEKMVAAQRN